jgi:shikimate 5-dehydrogenase
LLASARPSSTPPLGLRGQPTQIARAFAGLGGRRRHYYLPLKTPLLRNAEAGESSRWMGSACFIAVPGFERWFGRRPAVSRALRAAVIADLDQP